MAKERTLKEGLEFFPLDVDYFEDSKILKIEASFGIAGSLVATRILCAIYRNGYYMKWDDDEALVIARKVGNNITWETVKEIVNGLMKCDFFSDAMFAKFGILTSKGIQERWNKIITDCNRKAKIKSDFNLLMQYQKSDLRIEKSDLLPEKSEETQQSKVKESKVEESKANDCGQIENDDFKYVNPVPREAIDLTEKILDYFSASKDVMSPIYSKVENFIAMIFHRGEFDKLKTSFDKYRTYKARSQEQIHSIEKWMGSIDAYFKDGKWTETNWGLKLENYEQQSTKGIHGSTGAKVTTDGSQYAAGLHRR